MEVGQHNIAIMERQEKITNQDVKAAASDWKHIKYKSFYMILRELESQAVNRDGADAPAQAERCPSPWANASRSGR